MTLDPGLTFEGLSHDIDPVMSLSAFPVPGMACMLVRFILHLEALGRESLGQLLCDGIGGSHTRMIPKSGNRFPAFAKSASAGEARSDKIMRNTRCRFVGLSCIAVKSWLSSLEEMVRKGA